MDSFVCLFPRVSVSKSDSRSIPDMIAAVAPPTVGVWSEVSPLQQLPTLLSVWSSETTTSLKTLTNIFQSVFSIFRGRDADQLMEYQTLPPPRVSRRHVSVALPRLLSPETSASPASDQTSCRLAQKPNPLKFKQKPHE